MKKGHQIAILLRHPCQLSNACHCAREMMKIGAVVSFYCLCSTSGSKIKWNISALLDTQAQCFTNSHDLALRNDLECLSFGAVVQGIGSADWIIPM